MNERLKKVLDSDPFATGANLDLSGFPALQDTGAADASFVDDRFSQLSEDRPRRLASTLPDFVNANSADPEVQRILAEGGVQPDSATFQLPGGVQGEIKFDTKRRTFVSRITLGGKHYYFRAADRDDAMLAAANYLSKQQGPRVRNLNDAELLRVSRIASTNLPEAIGLYLELAIDGNNLAEHGVSPENFVNDPRFRDLCDAAVTFCWFAGRPGVTDSRAWQRFKYRYVASRPLTVKLLDAAWKQFQKTDATEIPAEAAPQTEPEQPDFENLSDEQVAKLYSGISRENAKAQLKIRRMIHGQPTR